MTRCGCGRALQPADRFCSQCGTPVADLAPAGSTDNGAGDLLIGGPPASRVVMSSDIGAGAELVDPGTVESTSRIRSGPPMRWVAAGLAMVALLTWALYQWPQPEAQTAVGGDGGSPALDDSAGADAEAEEQERTTTTRRPRRTTGAAETAGAGSDDAAGVEADEGPPPQQLLGEATGLGLAIGSYDSPGDVAIVDLDTGRSHELEGVVGIPVGAIGTNLIVSRFGKLDSVDLSADDPAPVEVVTSGDGWVEFLDVDDDRIWVVSEDNSEEADRVIEAYTLDGELDESLEMSAWSWPLRWGGGGDLVPSPAGGIYRRTESGYERVSTGQLRAAGDRVALVDECDDRMRCRSVWRDIDTWADAGLPAPAYQPDSFASVEGDDRWLIVFEYTTNQVVLSEIRSGDEVRRLSNENMYSPFGQAALLSPDGRWLVDQSPGATVIVDLDRGTEWPLELPVRRDSVVTFLELDGTTIGG